MAVAFPPGSSELPNNYRGPLKALADKRGKASVIVVGYGEAVRSDPHDQSAGLSLALARAQAIAAALAAVGVPPASIQVQAEAAGRGGAVRLVD
jgi:outer membrane protein OmpA-like peptidoglycan-associated protein